MKYYDQFPPLPDTSAVIISENTAIIGMTQETSHLFSTRGKFYKFLAIMFIVL